MKTAVVYYSMSGNTELVAQQVATALDADVVALEPKKEYPDKGWKKFFWGGKSAVMKEEPPLQPYVFDADRYDLVVLGSPVWASRFAPPLRTFVKENAEGLRGKKLAAFVCYSGGGADKALLRLQQAVGGDGWETCLASIDPLEKPTEEKQNEIAVFCQQLQRIAKK